MANNSAEQADLMLQSKELYLSGVLTHNLDDIQQAVRCAEELLDLMPPDSPQMPIIQYHLARALVRRFLHLAQVEDVGRAIDLFQNALQLLTDVNPMHKRCRDYVVFSCLVRDTVVHRSVNVDGIRVCVPDGGIMTGDLRCRNSDEDEEVFEYYQRKTDRSPESMDDLNYAIFLHQHAELFFSSARSSAYRDPLKISKILMNLGVDLARRYAILIVRSDNDKAVDCFCRALKLPMRDRPMLVDCLVYASGSLIKRFDALGKREDLERAGDYAQHALENIDMQDVLRFARCLQLHALENIDLQFVLRFARCVQNVGHIMVKRYEVSGELKDLDAAIFAKLCAVNITKQTTSKTNLHLLQIDLAESLKLRSRRTGQSEDLRRAVNLCETALDLVSDDVLRIGSLLALSGHKYLLSDREQDMEYRKRAMGHLQEAWSLGRQHHISNPRLNFDLYVRMSERMYEARRFDKAIEILRSIDSIPDLRSHPEARQYLLILCVSLSKRWEDTHRREDIDEAIGTARRMIEGAEGRPDGLTIGRTLLGNCLYQRYKTTRDNEDLEGALAVLQEGLRTSAGVPMNRLIAGQVAINILCDLAAWSRAHKVSQEISDLVMIINGRFLEWKDREYWLGFYSDEVPKYASIALQAGSDIGVVIDILETYRGSILGSLIDKQTDLDDLKTMAPEKAERFNTLRDKVNATVFSSGTMNADVKDIIRSGEAEAEYRACLQDIRKLEGFHRFLLGPTQSEVEAAAAHGPILIVIITSIRSDAIIITTNGSVLLKLPRLDDDLKDYHEMGTIDFSNLEEIGKKNIKYRRFLKLLWDKCVNLIFQELDRLVPGTAKFHVWWIGVGMAGSLPFHAAGNYSRPENLCETALSRAISSYTPTLKILIHERRKIKNNGLKPDVQRSPSKPEILIVTMPTTPSMPSLEGVEAEAKVVQEKVQGVYSIQLNPQPCAKDTMERMEKCEIVHFACHGQSIPANPSSSYIALQTTDPDSKSPIVDELRVRDVATLNLSHGKLAVLSACCTAENRLLTDEVLHLASGLGVAGYLHTVGNLWEADDKVSVKIVEGFYHYLVDAGELGDGQNVAKALNKALIDVVKTKRKQPLSWAQFVHFGV